MAYSPKADDINILINDVPELTEEEKSTLLSAMKKAQELDAQERNKMSRVLEGQLYKYTNVVKGWQYRWFILNPETGNLEYYMLDEVKKKRPRGCIYLAGAVVSPSDEDGQSFAINAACGEVYKLKANDPKERQFWVNRIRAVAEHQTETIAEKNPPLPPREHRSMACLDLKNGQSSEGPPIWCTTHHSTTSIMDVHPTSRKRSSRKKSSNTSIPLHTTSSISEAIVNVRDKLNEAEEFNNSLTRAIESLPHTGCGPKCCDTNLLLLKATSSATLLTLQQCYSILQQQQVTVNFSKIFGSGHTKEFKESLNIRVSSSSSDVFKDPMIEVIDPSGEVCDSEDLVIKDTPLGEESRGVIINLMSQLKLGTDLTTITFPSFILEPRSLLEMFADCLGHPDFLIKITDCPTSESRMLAVIEWYLTAFHAGREANVAKKPFNPILGETFRCSWKVYKFSNEEAVHSSENLHKVTYVAEQVSHHPPVSAFYVECPKKNLAMSAHIGVKSNFLTSYVAANFAGEVKLQILSYGETYIFTLPSAYVRCVLSVPWIELGGRVSVSCPATGYNASVTFQTKPQQSGTPHKIAGEIKHNDDVKHRISGEWNGLIQFTSNEGEVRSINVQELQRHRKYLRPLDQQDDYESRNLWQHVTKALLEEDYEQATLEKQKLENQQREEEKKRISEGTEYSGKLFRKVDDTWKYKYPLP